MERRGKPNRGPEHVGDYSDVVGTGHRGYFPELGETAADTDVRLHDVQRALLKHAPEGPVTTQLLRAGNPHLQSAANLDIPFDIVGADGLLKPQEIVFRELPAYRYGGAAGIGAVGVHREQYVVTDGAAHCRNVLDVIFRAEANLHLHRLEALVSVAPAYILWRG